MNKPPVFLKCVPWCAVCETYGPRCKQRVAVRNEWPKSAMFEDLEVPIAKRASGVLWFLTCSYLPAVKTWQEQSKHRHHRTGWHHKRTRQNKTHREQHLCSRMLQDASGCFKMLWTCVRHMGPVCKQKVQTGASDSKLLCEESGSPNSKNGHWTTVVLILIILF